MKNLFKNLMLVAVAAMAFVACQNEPEMVINGGEKTTITFDAKFDETRSQFGEKTEGAYPSFWTGDEVAAFNHWTVENGNYENVEVAIDAEDRFLVEFYRAVENGHIIDAYVPASAWGEVKNEWTWNDDYTDFYYTAVYREYAIPTEQNPTATSVDEKAHILKATVTYAGSDSVELVFQHQVAYGRFSVKNLALEAGDAVVSAVLSINGKSYVVNTDASADVWFACDEAEVENMSVAINTVGNKAYTKTLVEGANKALAFVKGQVSAFTVNMEGVTSGEVVEVFEPDYLMDALAWDSSNGRFKMTGASLPYPANDYVAFYLNSEDCTTTSINPGVYTGNGNGSSNNTNPAKGQFAGRMSLNWGTVTYPKAFTSASTLTVSFENDVYTVVLDHNGTTYGYKGMPEGWNAPDGSSTPEPEPEPEPEQPEQPEQPEVSGTVELTKLTMPSYDGKNLSFNDGALSMTLIWTGPWNPNGTYSLVAGYSSDNATAHSILVNGIAATTVSGTLTVEYQSYGQYLFIVTFNDVVIDGVSYTGTVSTPF